MWEDIEPDFLLLGISDTDYWELPPSLILKLAKKIRETKEYEAEEKLELSRITALLTAVGINNPKNFPKTLIKDRGIKIEDTDYDAQAEALMKFKNKYK